MSPRAHDQQSAVDPIEEAVRVAQVATGEREAPASSQPKPTASPEVQEAVAAITAELAAAGVTIRWR